MNERLPEKQFEPSTFKLENECEDAYSVLFLLTVIKINHARGHLKNPRTCHGLLYTTLKLN
ncbi:hypothetical protein [Sideroxydans sp. CL21]|nr:hypothetical protein [Sideroxydans sp. CL21]